MILVIFLLLTTFVNATNKVQEFNISKELIVENKNLSLCSSSISVQELIQVQSTNYQLEPRDVYVSSDIPKIFCFGKIVDFWEVEGNKIVLFFGTNNKLFNLLSFTANLFLLTFSLYLYFKKNLKPTFIFFSIVIFNFVLNELFLFNFNLINLFTDMEIFIEFFSPIFLLIPFVTKNNNLLFKLKVKN